MAAVLAALLFGAGRAPAKREDPAVKKYLKEVKQRQQAKDRAEKQQRRRDPDRRLRPYLTLDEIYAEMDKIAAAHPGTVSVEEIGKSREGRPLRVVRFTTGSAGKAEVLYLGNIHAQELAGGMVCLAIIRYLAEGLGQDCYVDNLLKDADIYVLPVENPDRMVKATGEQARFGLTGFIRKNADQVDLNRNFPYPADAPGRLKASAGSHRKISTAYRGPAPLSEPESRVVNDFIGRRHFVAVHSYHTSGGLIMYPPGTFPERTADDALFQQIAQGYQDLQFDKYKVEPEIDLYPTIGALDDYLYHHYGILATTVEIGKTSQLFHRLTIFWLYNVYELDREIADNLLPALSVTEQAIKVHQNPELLKWQPPTEKWVGEP
jgi:predicted deacylase